ncbi:MAG: ABC transporter substrate-binding protein [Oscillospiraceae bacterium]|nr:ABC transporter substrate-binding protein [Oscillospiraceae bacterium]
MRKLNKAAAVSLALALLLVMAAGCGKSELQAGKTSESPEGEPRREEIFIGIAQDIDDSLDPHLMTSAESRSVLFNVFEGLVKPTPDGKLAPAVAASYSVSETGDKFTFKLRSGVSFHNGDPVTTDDVVYSISRVAGLDTGTPLISAFSIVESVASPDDGTVVIVIGEANIEFLAYLTAAIIPKGYDSQETQPVGTGPYRYVSRSPQENIILERFDDYWGGATDIGRVTYRILDNAEALMMALRSGTLDFCAHLTATQMNELVGFDYNFVVGTMNLVQAVYLNNAVAPLDNETVRRALSHAIDRGEIMDVLSGGLGVPVGSSMYPAFTKYFSPELADYYAYDPELARQLLAEAGFAGGFELEIAVPSNHSPHIDTATVVVEQLREVGVTATIKLVEWGTWISDIYTGREFQATVVGVDASAMTARAMLERFESTNGRNFTNFSDAEYDEVFAAAIASTDDAEQVRLYKRLEAILTERAANLYIQDLCDVIAISKDVAGYEPYPMFILDISKLHFTD